MDNVLIKKKLQEELQLVEKELAELGQKNSITGKWETSMGEVDATATERDEIADRLEDFEERQDETKGLGARREDIIRALTKINEGTYGTCEVCGAPIGETRLEANLAARTCISHA